MEKPALPETGIMAAITEGDTAKGTLRVLLVDDHPVVRDGLAVMLKGHPHLEVVGGAGSGEEALEQALRLNPNVVLMDIRLPGIDGIEATHRLKAAHPSLAVIILTMFDSEAYLIESLRAGAAGYLVKDCSRDLLCSAISAAAAGGAMVRSRQALKSLPTGWEGSRRESINLGEGEKEERLTSREREVLHLVARGLANKDIARELNLAEVTVKKHVQSLMGKLGVSNRTNAAVLALRLGLTN